jgi:hypothetical protein
MLSGLTIEVLVREPRYQGIKRNDRGQAQPDADVEKRQHEDREQQERQSVPVSLLHVQ